MLDGILQFSAPCSLGDRPSWTSVSLVHSHEEEASLAGASLLLARSRPLSVPLSYLEALAEPQSLRAGSSTGPSGDPTRLWMAAGTRGPQITGKGRALLCARGGEAGDWAILLL